MGPILFSWSPLTIRTLTNTSAKIHCSQMSHSFDDSPSSAGALWYARCVNKPAPIKHICARTTIDQNAPAEERGRDRNLLRTEVIKSCGRNAQQFVPVRTCHRHSAIHPQVSCELDLPASICKLPRCLRKVELHKKSSSHVKLLNTSKIGKVIMCNTHSTQWPQMSF